MNRGKKVNSIIENIITIYTNAFPQRVKAIFLTGSYGRNYAIANSDIDIDILFEGIITNEIREQAIAIGESCDALCSMEIDITIYDYTAQLPPDVFLGGKLIYGDNNPTEWNCISVERWARERMYAGTWLIAHLFGRDGTLTLPIDYPDNKTLFFGYDDRQMYDENNSVVKSSKNILRASGWAATALVGYQGNTFVSSKEDLVPLFKKDCDKKWINFLTNIYDLCRNQWNYVVPQSECDIQKLISICEENLLFENYFLSKYKTFLLDELSSGDENRIKDAISRCKETPFYDDEIINGIKKYDSMEID